MAKFYQHVNSDDPLFQKVTKLLYVDDSDPDILLYTFEDGTKCSPDFIGKIDEIELAAGQYQMVEVESPVNIWRFKPVKVTATTILAKNADGQDVEVPDPYFIGLSGANAPLNGGGPLKEGTRWESRAPRKAVRPVDDINEYFASYIKYAADNNIAINKDIDIKRVMTYISGSAKLTAPAVEQQTLNTGLQQIPAIPEPVQEPEVQKKPTTTAFTETKKQLIIDADDLIKSNDYDIVELTFNGELYKMDLNTFFTRAIEEKKVVVEEKKEIPVEPLSLTENDIEIGEVSNTEWNLINNMINMSQKEECTIDMELILSLPPVDVYKLIKTAYPKGLSDVFVKTIANRMPVKELKTALANGLLSYYDGGADIIKENETEEEEEIQFIPQIVPEKPVVEKPTTTRKPRAKKAQ